MNWKLPLTILLAHGLAFAEWMPVTIEAGSYPALATQAKLSGTVRLRVNITEKGAVASVDVLSGHQILARAARENIAKWEFAQFCQSTQPGTGGSIEVAYEFVLEGPPSARPQARFRYHHPGKVTISANPQLLMPSARPPKR